MPYVPGFEQDVFVSYASEDRAWVQEFQGKLLEILIERGVEARLWRDQENIRFGQNWKQQMFKAVEQSALFLAVLSPNYRQSNYCSDESDLFQELREKGKDLKVSEQELYRYLKVIKTAWDNDSHRGVLPELQDIEFFVRDQRRNIDFPMSFTSTEFSNRIREAAYAVEATLKAMRRLREMVFVASPTDDVQESWAELRTELAHQGYVVGPQGKLWRGMAKDFIQNEFKGAVLSIHLLGSEYQELTERQLDLCAESGQRMAVWIKKDADKGAGEEQQRLLRRVREFEAIPKGTPVIEGSMGRTPLMDLLELLKPKGGNGAPAAGGEAGSMIYLICDGSVEEDRQFAAELEAKIEAKEKMQVVLPERDVPGAHERHLQLLRECDGVLLFREKAPEPWFSQYVMDVARAEKLIKRATPIRSKAILAGEEDFSDLAFKNVQLIGRGTPFVIETLEPFLEPLRSRAQGGAHAGN